VEETQPAECETQWPAEFRKGLVVHVSMFQKMNVKNALRKRKVCR